MTSTQATVALTARRAATDADGAFLRALYASTRSDLDALGWPDEVRSAFCELQWRAQRACYEGAHPGARDEILEVDGSPVGHVLVDATGDDLVLVDVALLPAWRGRGLGRRIVGDVQRDAAASGRGVRIHVSDDNPARRLYERLGFQATNRAGVHTEMRWRP